MAEVKSYKCDECGVQKMESNHWVIGLLYPMGSKSIVQLGCWDAKMAEWKGAIHLCGEGCTAKIVSRQIQAWRAQ
jgi:hypothetical protein